MTYSMTRIKPEGGKLSVSRSPFKLPYIRYVPGMSQKHTIMSYTQNSCVTKEYKGKRSKEKYRVEV